MSISNKIIEVKNLSHRYSVDWAIKDINFDISNKGVVGLLGSNGAGKSTTMNIICGVLNQTHGDIFLNGVNMKENPILAKKQIGFLPQKAPLHIELTVDEYLYNCAELRYMKRKDIPEAMERVKAQCGISHFSKRLIKNLSGGYQQRVGIAQSIIHNPPFIVLDEPTNGLDPNQILEVRKLIKEIAKERAVLISTHILPEVQAMCDEIKMIEKGVVVFSGTIDEFNACVKPSTIVTMMSNAPSNEEFMKIESVKRIERLTNYKMRIHFDGDETILKNIMTQSVNNDWGLTEIYLEKDSLDTVFARLSGKN